MPTAPKRWPYQANGIRVEAILIASKIKQLTDEPLELNSKLDPIDVVRRFGQIAQAADHIIHSLQAVSPDGDAERPENKNGESLQLSPRTTTK